MGDGLRAAVLDAISASPVAPVAAVTSSKNGQNATIRVTSELARSEDPFVRCAGCGVGQGRRAPVHARASRNQLSSEKHTLFGRLFFRVFAERSPTPYFYNEISHLRGPNFHNFDSKMAKLLFWPKRGQWDPMWSEFDSVWIKFDPNWVKLGPNEAQYIFIYKLPINRPSGRYVI